MNCEAGKAFINRHFEPSVFTGVEWAAACCPAGLFQFFFRGGRTGWVLVHLKAAGCTFPIPDPTGPAGMMYAETGTPRMNTSNHPTSALWEPYGLPLVPTQMNGIPFHTRQLIFRRSHFPPFLSKLRCCFINLFYKPPPPFTTFRSINPALRLRLLLRYASPRYERKVLCY